MRTAAVCVRSPCCLTTVSLQCQQDCMQCLETCSGEAFDYWQAHGVAVPCQAFSHEESAYDTGLR